MIEIGVEKQSPSAKMAKEAEDAAARKILASLRSSGIDSKDIRTNWLSLQPESCVRKGVRIAYFVATQTLSVTVRDLDKLDAVLESLIQAGGNRIDSVVYETGDLRKYRDQARDLAVRAAREKAEAMAHSLGQEIGKASLIEEVAEPFDVSTRLANKLSFNGGVDKSRSAAPSTAAGQNSISASVLVVFELN